MRRRRTGTGRAQSRIPSRHTDCSCLFECSRVEFACFASSESRFCNLGSGGPCFRSNSVLICIVCLRVIACSISSLVLYLPTSYSLRSTAHP